MRVWLNERTVRVYELLDPLPRNDYLTPMHNLPENGIYLFFEEGENVVRGDELANRNVRVGIRQV